MRELRGVALLPDDNFLRRRMLASAGGRTIDLLAGWLGRDGALIELHLALLSHPALGANTLGTLATLLDSAVKAEGRRVLEPEAVRELLAAFEAAYFRMPIDAYGFTSGFLHALKLSGQAEPRRIVELAVRYQRHAAARGEHADMTDALEIFVFQHDKRFYTPELILSMADAAFRHAPARARHITGLRFKTLATWAEKYVDAGPEKDRLLAALDEKRALALGLAPVKSPSSG
ncbi:MAG: hypothetical protein AAB262_14725 [Elusimicrobiota bacterium]